MRSVAVHILGSAFRWRLCTFLLGTFPGAGLLSHGTQVCQDFVDSASEFPTGLVPSYTPQGRVAAATRPAQHLLLSAPLMEDILVEMQMCNMIDA